MPKLLSSLNESFCSTVSEYSVTQISRLLKETIEQQFNYVRIRGEISGYKHAASRHSYFNLKDKNAIIKAVCWHDIATKLDFQLMDGLEVIVSGRLSIYEGQSSYQIVVQKIEHAGSGALLALLEKRKAKLQAEGLFDSSRKKTLPFLPKTIGIITSPTGAVIEDILHRIRDRMGLHVIIWPVLVQGAEAANQIAMAIEGFNSLPLNIVKPDVLIVARGGGSIEDLWAFNEEIVIRAVASCSIPLVSAVGHETDNTLIDYVCDLRAPTPTAAAEMVVPIKINLLNNINNFNERLRLLLLNSFKNRENQLANVSASLINFSQKLLNLEYKLNNINHELKKILTKFITLKASKYNNVCMGFSSLLIDKNIMKSQSKLSLFETQINNLMNYLLVTQKDKLYELNSKLEEFNYKKFSEKGFIFAQNANGKIIKTKRQALEINKFFLNFNDGEVKVAIVKNNLAHRYDSQAVKLCMQNKLFD